MPQRRQPRKRRARVNKKKRAPSNKTLAKRINKVSNTIIELKFKDESTTSIQLSQASFTYFVAPCFTMQTGDTASTRTGNKIYATSADASWIMQPHTGLTAVDSDTVQRIRCIAFWDRQANGGTPATNQILDVSVIGDRTLAPRNYNYIHRFDIVWDKVFVLNPVVAFQIDGSTNTDIHPVTYKAKQIYKRKRFKFGRVISYEGNVGDITDVQGNIFYLAMVTNNDGPTDTLGPFVSLGARMYYKDA